MGNQRLLCSSYYCTREYALEVDVFSLQVEVPCCSFCRDFASVIMLFDTFVRHYALSLVDKSTWCSIRLIIIIIINCYLQLPCIHLFCLLLMLILTTGNITQVEWPIECCVNWDDAELTMHITCSINANLYTAMNWLYYLMVHYSAFLRIPGFDYCLFPNQYSSLFHPTSLVSLKYYSAFEIFLLEQHLEGTGFMDKRW